MHKINTLIKNENPAESEYYESIGRANLFDLGVITDEVQDAFQNSFSNIPIAILEIKDDKATYIRSTRSYQDFMKRFFNAEILENTIDFNNAPTEYGLPFITAVRQCCTSGNNSFFDEILPNGSIIRSFVRRISVNPITGGVAVAVAVLSISEPSDSTTYADIARALAADYYNIYVIDLDTDRYTEYSSRIGGEELTVERYGEDFFNSAKRDTLIRIFEEDREQFLKLFTRENILHDLDKQGVFTATYRLIDSGIPVYVNMKITRMRGGNRIILGVSNIDAQMEQQEEGKRLRQEKTSLGRIAALSANYIVLYTVDPETGHYTQYSPSSEFERFGLAEHGEDFFGDVLLDAPKAIAPEDMERHLRVLTKENMLDEIKKNGFFIHNYGLLIDGKTIPVTLKATLTKEDDGEKIILGVSKVTEDNVQTQ